ncbi:acyl-CoA dehydrogenase family protein [Sphingosinicella terrae]|uniref:acyl-CoA dehydrogenase family protein n=1 Tax=Sphingosinicella terrae TaxID=2172047 RepID=UPI000E0D1ECB|nr:acyl-CoA dehydrogenase family protein [Sphingosinicella terrae]
MTLARQERPVFSSEHDQFRETVRRFFRDEVDPHYKAWEKVGIYDPAIFRKAGEYGILQAGIPAEYGGMGGDFLHHAILHEEAGYSLGGISMGGGLSTDSSSYLIFAGGTEGQKREWLPRYASGEVIAEACFTEPHAGSDLRAIRTIARRSGSDYVINGAKMWCTNGVHLNLLLTYALVEKEDGSVGAGIFLVDGDMPGVTKSRPIETIHRGCGAETEIFYEDVRVPADRLLGESQGNAMASVLKIITDMRVAQACRFLAGAETAFDLTVDYVRSRKAFGQTVYDFQATQHALAEMKTAIATLRPFVDQCLDKIRHGTLTPAESAMAKLAASETEFSVADRCLQLHGGMGIALETPISGIWATARIHRIFLGTSEIQKNAIAHSI